MAIEFAFHGFADLGKRLHVRIFGEEKVEELDTTPVPHVLHLKRTRCGLCDGRGVHVNPSIDSHGISAEEFDEDPDFRDEYFSGTYDMTCYECKGSGVSLGIDEKRTSTKALKAAQNCFDDEASYRDESAAERRMGA